MGSDANSSSNAFDGLSSHITLPSIGKGTKHKQAVAAPAAEGEACVTFRSPGGTVISGHVMTPLFGKHDPPVPLTGLLLMGIIGVGYLFPISAIWASFDYWKEEFPDRKNVEFLVSCSYQLFAVLTVAVLSVIPPVHFVKGIGGGFTGQFVAIFIITCFPLLTVSPDVKYYILLLLVIFCAITTGFLDSGLLSLCAQYSPRMQGALQVGIGFSTSVSVAYRDITKLALPGKVTEATIIYFVIALITIIICITAFLSLKNMDISRHIFDKNNGSSSGDQKTQSLLPKSEKEKGMSRTPLQLFKVVWKNELSVATNFALTLAAYPGLVTAITPQSAYFDLPDSWYQTYLITCFAFFDTLSRFLISYRCGLSWKNIHIVVMLRCLLFPCVILCVLGYTSDIVNFLIVAFYGLSNGYVCSLALVVVNEIPGLTQAERGTVGRWSAFSVNAGLCIGSFIGIGLGSLLQVS